MKKRRVLYFNVLNVTICFGVVSMHINRSPHAYSSSFDWRHALFVDCLFYWTIPVFSMLTDAKFIR